MSSVRPTLTAALCLATGLALAACQDLPREGLEQGFALSLQPAEGRTRAALDILFVVDGSAGMCQEQVALASAFGSGTRLPRLVREAASEGRSVLSSSRATRTGPKARLRR